MTAGISRGEIVDFQQTVKMSIAGQSKGVNIFNAKLFLLNEFFALMRKLFVWMIWFAENA